MIKTEPESLKLSDVVAGSCVPKWKKRSEETTMTDHIQYLDNRPTPNYILLGTSMFERIQYTDEGKQAAAKYKLDKLSYFNCSCGGDRICNILYRLTDLRILDYVKSTPKKIIFMAGANDLEGTKIPVMIDGMQQILSIVKEKFPDSEVHVLGVFPRISDDVPEDVLYSRVVEFNRLLKEVCCSMSVNFHNFGKNVIDAKGNTIRSMFVDNVHFSDSGYDQLVKELMNILQPES
eukprot:TRINITY_DN36790_c0_g1_i1.p1 TRINITY_DN36790_c0_g1~~TRINITY_DN36790_c0_g1_i1.p1  ORF type:complete len:262 (+),score=62.00 TRINITY_DN36790_c0_g1_i1:86-787(+)